jgi:hypothetical protein
MSDEDDAESMAYSDSDRLDAEIRQLTWVFLILAIIFFSCACWALSALAQFMKGF